MTHRPLPRALKAVVATLFVLSACAAPSETSVTDECDLELIVLGAGQDAGAPQIGNRQDPAWTDPEFRLFATSLGLVDRRSPARYLFEATPNITDQLQLLDETYPDDRGGLGIDGVFLTHAHIGHYAGLMMLGREAAGAKDTPVYTAPRMAAYLRENGPWSQLVSLGNIELNEQPPGETRDFGDIFSVTSIHVPHRDEFSETIAYRIDTGDRTVLFAPDIDDWDTWKSVHGVDLVEMIKSVDLAFLDATFFDDDELPGRDMSKIPHPRVADTMERLAHLPAEIRARVHFIHYNHTNPIRFPDTVESQLVGDKGFRIARRRDRFCLTD